MLDWTKLLSSKRLPKKDAVDNALKEKHVSNEHRTAIERDYDRILFSTPVRRLADKTQVFPLEKNDSVRTRLTHSFEVSNLARSMGTALVHGTDIFNGFPRAVRDVPAILAAIGLAHDLGNPPFGHQGENAISTWFKNYFEKNKEITNFSERMKGDFTRFEGNAQTLRVVTKLQVLNDNRGLNLTLATLAALIKYPVPSNKVDKTKQHSKKFNYFISEDDVIESIRTETGLSEGIRHPLTFIMEACDDIAYSVLDIEDSVKKNIVSVSDIIFWLQNRKNKDETQDLTIRKVVDDTFRDFEEYKTLGLSAAEFNDVCTQKFRVHAIAAMVNAVLDRYPLVVADMLNGTYQKELIADSRAAALRDALKEFAKTHSYVHPSVLRIELQGYNTIHGLMDIFWKAIRGTKDGNSNPYDTYVYNKISENYRRVADNSSVASSPYGHPLYRDFQLLTDMVSGMTDGFAMSFYKELQSLKSKSSV